MLVPRLLLSCAAARTGNPGLALLNFEKLMVLAVGQGDLFVAIACQCSLDALRSGSTPHSKRYQAMQQWFKALSPKRSRKKSGLALTPAMLVKLPAADFQRMVENSTIETLELAPSEIQGAGDLFAILLHGRVKWTLHPEGEDAMPTVVAEAGDTLSAPEGTNAGDRLRFEPEQPSVLLRFSPAAAPALRDLVRRDQKAAADKKRIPIAPVRLTAPSVPARPAIEPTAPRPAPDPNAEPLTAVHAPHLRRSEHDIGVTFASGEARLGLAGTRVAPLTGKLVELSPAGMRLEFPRAALRQSRPALEGAMALVDLEVPGGDEPLHLLARVTALTFEAAAATPAPAHLSLEFALLLARDRARMQEALIEAARSGRWLGSDLAAADAADESATDADPAAGGGAQDHSLDATRRSA